MTEQDHDGMRDRVRSLDPAAATPDVAPSQIQRLKEHAMTQTDQHPTDTPAQSRRLPLLAAAAALVALAGLGGYALMNDDPAPPPAATPENTLDLTMPDSNMMASCIQFDEEFLAQMSPAFKGTAVEVTDEAVTLEVDRWYAGADEADNATRVTLTTPGEQVLLEGGVSFAEGTSYLITAADGMVNSCGFSGEATPELEASFERAFGG